MKTHIRSSFGMVQAALLVVSLAALLATAALAQSIAAGDAGSPCTCGSHPPKPRPQRTIEPYANEPKDLQPY